MDRTTGHRLVAGLIAVGGTGVVYWTAADVVLAAVVGIVWGSASAVTLRIARGHHDRMTGTSWQDKRWTGLGVGLVSLAALVGVGPSLHVSADVRLGLGWLVLGAGVLGYVTGTMAELERIDD